MSSLSDYQQNKIQARIKRESPFCNIKDYKKTNITNDVTKITFGVTYNTLGHVLFGSLSFGIASIAAENSKNHVYYFDTSTGDMLGSTQSEAESYFNNKVNNSIDKCDLATAEKYLSKLCGLSNSNANRLKYDILKKLNVIMRTIKNDKIRDAINFDAVNANLNSLPNNFKKMIEKLKNEAETFCNNKIDISVDNFDLATAELYLKKLCGLSNSEENNLKYAVIEKLIVILKHMEEGQIQDAITNFETINQNLCSLPAKFQIIIEKFKIELDKLNSTHTSEQITIPEHPHEDFHIDWEFTTQTRIM